MKFQPSTFWEAVSFNASKLKIAVTFDEIEN